MKPLAYIILICLSFPAYSGPLDETRYCGPPKRNDKGEIIRRADVIREFKKIHPCPVTGESKGPCPGWAIDHVIPLACGGCDSVSNMQWLPDEIKSAARIGKDRFERKIYGGHIAGQGDCSAPEKIKQFLGK